MAAIFAEAQVPYAKIMGCAKLVPVPREFPAWLGRAQGAKPVFKSVSGLSGPNFWPDVPVQASCLTRRIVHHVGVVIEARGMPHDRLAWDVYLLRCTRFGKGQSRRRLLDAVSRGIHSAVIREASALVLKSFAHPAR